jgi:hypothetical protein
MNNVTLDNHDAAEAKKWIGKLGNTPPSAVSNPATNPYHPLPPQPPYFGRVTMIGATPGFRLFTNRLAFSDSLCALGSFFRKFRPILKQENRNM